MIYKSVYGTMILSKYCSRKEHRTVTVLYPLACRLRSISMTKELSRLLKLLNGHRVFIQTHNFPDPDAIASAFGLQELLKHFGIKTTICYHGTDVRSATASMINLLEIEMFSDRDIKMSAEDYIVTVDAQKGNSNILDLDGNEVACIDHHPTFCEAESYRFMDVRIVGSCATIIADYYRANKIKMSERVATALLYGLKMDTKDFTRSVTQMDIDIFSYLFRQADNKMIRHFQTNVLQYNELESFADSMHSIEIYNGIAFVFLDFACADAFVATVSDFILDLDAVVFVVVYSRKGNGFKFSVRSELEELDSGAITAKALKDCGSGGGHRTMAGGYADEVKLLEMSVDFRKTIQNLFLNVIEKKRGRESILADNSGKQTE